MSKMAGDSDLVTIKRLLEMGTGTWESNVHVTDYVTWPRNVMVLAPMLLEAIFRKRLEIQALFQRISNMSSRMVTCSMTCHVSSLLIYDSLRISRHVRIDKLLANIEKRKYNRKNLSLSHC